MPIETHPPVTDTDWVIFWSAVRITDWGEFLRNEGCKLFRLNRPCSPVLGERGMREWEVGREGARVKVK